MDPYINESDMPMFKAIEYRNPRRKVVEPELRCLGILRKDGTYEAVTAHDYVSWIRAMTPRKWFPTGIPMNTPIMEALVRRLNDLFSENPYPPVPVMREAWREVLREALDDLGFTRKTPTTPAIALKHTPHLPKSTMQHQQL